MSEFPKLSITPREVTDAGVLRYGDGFITAEYPPVEGERRPVPPLEVTDQRATFLS